MLFPIGEPAINGFAVPVRLHLAIRCLSQVLIVGLARADRESKNEIGNRRLVFIVDDSDRLRTALVQFNRVFAAHRVARRTAVQRVAADAEIIGPGRQLRELIAVHSRGTWQLPASFVLAVTRSPANSAATEASDTGRPLSTTVTSTKRSGFFILSVTVSIAAWRSSQL